MQIDETKVLKLTIRAENQDTINVFLEDFSPGHGQITITSYGNSWVHYWPGMGNRKIHEFFCDCDAPYIIGKLLDYRKHDEFDNERTLKQIKRDLIGKRFEGYFSKEHAREMWDDIVNNLDGCSEKEMFLSFLTGGGTSELYDGDWYDCLQKRRTSDYNHLQNVIIPTVKAALVETFAIKKKSIDA